MSSSTIGSVIAASATANAKVFAIGIVGLLSTKFPRDAPFIPPKFVDTFARINFYLFMIPLYYSSLASIKIEELKTLWIVPLSAIVVIFLSYLIATVLGYLPCFRLYRDSSTFNVLRVATAFPNIIALPILIFPCICEYPIAYEAFGSNKDDMVINNGTTMTSSDMYEQCVAKSSSMIFLYFLGFNVTFWTFGAPKLMQSKKKQTKMMNSQDIETTHDDTDESYSEKKNSQDIHMEDDKMMDQKVRERNKIRNCWVGMKQAIISPGFIAMILGTLTAFISPLQRALFQQGGSLRFLGGALEGLGQSASILGTIVVATSLVAESEESIQTKSTTSPTDSNDNEEINHHETILNNSTLHKRQKQTNVSMNVEHEISTNFVNDEGIVTTTQHNTKDVCPGNEDASSTDDKRKPRISFQQIIKSLKFIVQSITKRKDYMKLSIWYIITRFIVTPAITCAIIIGLDCGGVISNVPNLFKLVIIVNSSLPVREIRIYTLSVVQTKFSFLSFYVILHNSPMFLIWIPIMIVVFRLFLFIYFLITIIRWSVLIMEGSIDNCFNSQDTNRIKGCIIHGNPNIFTGLFGLDFNNCYLDVYWIMDISTKQ